MGRDNQLVAPASRRVIRTLRPIYLEDLGLLTGLEMLTQDVEKATGVRGTFTSEGTAVRLRPRQRFYCPQQASDLAAFGHYGLLGMQERAELIGACLSIQSAPGAGAMVELELPL